MHDVQKNLQDMPIINNNIKAKKTFNNKFISDGKQGKKKESIKGVIANVNTQINKVVQ